METENEMWALNIMEKKQRPCSCGKRSATVHLCDQCFEDAVTDDEDAPGSKCTCAWEWAECTVDTPDDTANIAFLDLECPVHGNSKK